MARCFVPFTHVWMNGLSFLDDIEINFENKCEMRLFLNLETDFAFLGGYFLHPRLIISGRATSSLGEYLRQFAGVHSIEWFVNDFNSFQDKTLFTEIRWNLFLRVFKPILSINGMANRERVQMS